MDKNSAYFQMLLIPLSFIAIGPNSQISDAHVMLYSSNVKGRLRYLGHAQKPKFGEKLHTAFRVVTIFARFNFSRLSLAPILNTILSCI